MHTRLVEPRAGRVLKALALSLALVASLTAASYFVWPRALHPNVPEPAAPPEPADDQAKLFQNWPKPEVALILTGEGHGYLQPCGCSPIQKGGLARRFNFLQALIKERGWEVLGLDLGDMAQTEGPQTQIKYRYYMEALNRMPYVATALGQRELDMPFIAAVGEFSLNNRKPRLLAANLKQENRERIDNAVGAALTIQVANSWLKVGVVGILSDNVAKQIRDPEAKFEPEATAIPAAIQRFKVAPDFLVLLYHGSLDDAKVVAQKHPQFQVILCKSQSDEVSDEVARVGETMLINVGWKGKYVGVLGVSGQQGRPLERRYQRVEIGPEYETPQGKDASNPIHELLQKYAQEVKTDNYLNKYPQDLKHEVQASFPNSKYVGTERCGSCHDHAMKIWEKTPHHDAYKTLEERAKRPTLRQYDGECVKCHVVGFTYSTGFRNEVDTPKLKNVGCESCHGPGSMHANDPQNKEVRKAMNPWRFANGDRKVVTNLIDRMCQNCHDLDNSVGFKFETYWPKVEHPTPRNVGD